jgi:hypothetical protein
VKKYVLLRLILDSRGIRRGNLGYVDYLWRDDMSRQQSVLRNTFGYMLNYIDNQTIDGEEKSKPEVIKLGLDLHAKQVTECCQLLLLRRFGC